MDLFMGVKWCDLAKKDENSFSQQAIYELLSNLYKMNVEWFYLCKVSVQKDHKNGGAQKYRKNGGANNRSSNLSLTKAF